MRRRPGPPGRHARGLRAVGVVRARARREHGRHVADGRQRLDRGLDRRRGGVVRDRGGGLLPERERECAVRLGARHCLHLVRLARGARVVAAAACTTTC